MKNALLISIPNFNSNMKISNYFFIKHELQLTFLIFFTDTYNTSTNKPYIQKTGFVSMHLCNLHWTKIQTLAHPACEQVTASKILHTEKDSVHKTFLLKISHFRLTFLRTVAMRMTSQERLRGWCVSETHC